MEHKSTYGKSGAHATFLRSATWTAVAYLGAALFLFSLMGCVTTGGGPMVVRVVNGSAESLESLELRSQSMTQEVPPVAPGAIADVDYPVSADSGDEIVLYDTATDRGYIVHPYFEGDVSGRIEVFVTSGSPDLTGRVVIRTSWYHALMRPLLEIE